MCGNFKYHLSLGLRIKYKNRVRKYINNLIKRKHNYIVIKAD
jgi:hypothetical protein